MQDFQGKVAVITGAAGGIGRGLAERCVQEGMKVVLADVEESALLETAAALQAAGGQVLAAPTDVSQAAQVEALAELAWEQFGGVHLLFNNAGVAMGGPVWESTIQDWEWVLGVNLWGVIHGVRSFVPRMLAQDEEAHIINTSSFLGLAVTPGLGVYQVAKQGVMAVSETLYKELALTGAPIGVSVLCPGPVKTGIIDAARNRPPALQNSPLEEPATAEEVETSDPLRESILTGMPPAEVAEFVFRAVRDKRFYIFTHPELTPIIAQRFDDIVHGRNPTAPD